MKRYLFVSSILPILFIVFFVFYFNSGTVSALNQVHECDNCHQMHDATGGTPLLPEIDAENTCMTCHSPGGPATVKVSNHMGYTCMDCHDPHDNVQNWLGGENLKMVLADVEGSDGTVRPVVFESRGTGVGDPTLHSFCDRDQDGNGIYDNVCDTCHTSTKQHIGYPVPTRHNHKPGVTCTLSCHTHLKGFIK